MGTFAGETIILPTKVKGQNEITRKRRMGEQQRVMGKDINRKVGVSKKTKPKGDF